MHAPGIGLRLWTTCLLTGCAMGGLVSISEPNLDNSGTRDLSLDANGVLHIAQLSLSIKPQNARAGLIAVGPIVPLVPLGRGDELRKEKPFQIVVQFEASDERHTFAPRDTALLHAGAEYRPVESAGPFTRASAPRELQRASRGHDWVCNDTWTSKLSLPSQYFRRRTHTVVPIVLCVGVSGAHSKSGPTFPDRTTWIEEGGKTS